MQIVINGETRNTTAATLAELLEALDMSEAKVATALNGDFIGATQRAEVRLSAGDRIEIVAPRQGG